MIDEIIVARDIHYRYPTGNTDVLHGIDLTLRRGEFVGVVGTTGAGKTTLCQTLNGLVPHYTRGKLTGTVQVKGRDTTELSVADLSADVGLVFQNADAQLVMSTVEEECLIGGLSQGLPHREARQRAQEILERLEITHLAGRSPQALSGGQKQRVAIAAVMVTRPDVLVLDEATSELDAVMVQKIFNLCAQFNCDSGTTILLVSHEMELLARYAQRLILMKEGQIILDAPTRVALAQPEAFADAGVRLPQVTQYALSLNARVPWSALPLTEEEALPHVRQAFAAANIGTIATQPEAATLPQNNATPLVRITDVRFAYREPFTVLDNINLTIQPGEFTAIIGNNGSGKSTLMKLILGLLKPSAGQVVIDRVDTRQAKVSELARRIGFIFQDPNSQIFANTVAEEVRFGLKNLALPEAEITQRVEATLDEFGLQALRETFPRFLAHGDKQKLCIASIVAMHPATLLLDEPTTGQDHRDARQILDRAQHLNAQGITIVLITHDLTNVARYARRVIVVQDGRILADGPTETIMTNYELLGACHLAPPQVVRMSLDLADLGIPPALTLEALTESTLQRLNSHQVSFSQGANREERSER